MLKFIVKSLYQQIPNIYKRGNNYRKYYDFISTSSDWCKEEKLIYRNKKYNEMEVLYKNNCIEKKIDVAHIITKKYLQDNCEKFFIDRNKDIFFECMTGGSTGNPTKFYLSKEGVRKNEAFLDFILNQQGISRFSILRKVVFRGDKLPNNRDHIKVGNVLYLSSFSLDKEKIKKYLKLIESFKPSIIHAFPSSLMILVNFVLSERIQEDFYFVKHVLISSEVCDFNQKVNIKKIFKKAKIIDFYSNSEQTLMGYQIDFEDGVFPFQYGELYVDSNRVIYSTSFLDTGYLLFKYKTDDMVSGFYVDESFDYRYKNIDGRVQEFLFGYNKEKVSLASLNMHENFFESVIAFQFEQHECGKVIVNLVINNKYNNFITVENYFKEKLINFDVKFNYVDEIKRTTSGKEKLIISTCNINKR